MVVGFRCDVNIFKLTARAQYIIVIIIIIIKKDWQRKAGRGRFFY